MYSNLKKLSRVQRLLVSLELTIKRELETRKNDLSEIDDLLTRTGLRNSGKVYDSTTKRFRKPKPIKANVSAFIPTNESGNASSLICLSLVLICSALAILSFVPFFTFTDYALNSPFAVFLRSIIF